LDFRYFFEYRYGARQKKEKGANRHSLMHPGKRGKDSDYMDNEK
jgi:hypothetical protein